jgi:hypothetical protein
LDTGSQISIRAENITLTVLDPSRNITTGTNAMNRQGLKENEQTNIVPTGAMIKNRTATITTQLNVIHTTTGMTGTMITRASDPMNIKITALTGKTGITEIAITETAITETVITMAPISVIMTGSTGRLIRTKRWG